MAGLPLSGACVWVGPPLVASGPNFVSATTWSVPLAPKQVASSATFDPWVVNTAPQFVPVVEALARIVARRCTCPDRSFAMPFTVEPRLLRSVLLTKVASPKL